MPTRRLPSAEPWCDDGTPILQVVGRELQAARLARGEDLHDIAAYLRIKPHYLEALEAGDLAAMPGGPYTIGFLRNYGDHLGLDGRTLAARLRPAVTTASPRCEVSYREPLSDSRRPATSILAASLVLLGAAYAGYRTFLPPAGPPPDIVADPPRAAVAAEATPSRAPTPPPPGGMAGAAPVVPALGAEPALMPPPVAGEQPPPKPPVADVTSAVAAESAPAAAVPVALTSPEAEATPMLPAAASVEPQGRVVLVAHDDSWVQVRTPDRAFVRTRTLQSGERFVVPERDGLALWTGNAGGIELVLDGQSLGLVGASGAVVRNLPLTPEALKARPAPLR